MVQQNVHFSNLGKDIKEMREEKHRNLEKDKSEQSNSNCEGFEAGACLV